MKPLLLCLLLVGCASLSANFNSARSSTVFIGTDHGSSGSGVVINDNCVLTAEHVVHDAHNVIFIDEHERKYTVGTVTASEAHDLAILCTQEKINEPSVVFASHMPDLYAKVYVMGFPFQYKWVLTEGRYQGNQLVTAQAAPGNSGGGAFTDEGKYIGMVDAIAMYKGVGGFPHIDIIVEVDEIKAFLDEHRVIYGVER